MIRYPFRKPKYPLICDLGGTLIGARSERRLAVQLEQADLTRCEYYDMVDATGECWQLVRDHMFICPTIRKRLTKRQIIEMFNGSRTARDAGLEYPLRSLSNKLLARIVRDIATLLEKADRRT